MRTLPSLLTVMLLLAAACAAPDEPLDPETRWFFVRDRDDRAILAVEGETDGTFDLTLRGAWTVTVTGPYSVRVEGPGRAQVRDRTFQWDGTDLTDRVTKETTTRGKCAYVRRNGAVFEDLPFR